MYLKIEHMNYTEKGDYSFFHKKEKMFFNNKTSSSCDHVVVNLFRWYQMKVFLHDYYVAWACPYLNFLVKRTPNDNNSNKNNPHENNNSDSKNCSDDSSLNNNAEDIQTGTDSVQNKGVRLQSSSDSDFIANVEGTEHLFCHDIANFKGTLNLGEATEYQVLTGHVHPDDDFKFP